MTDARRLPTEGPSVLQVAGALDGDEAGRDTLDVAAALVEAGWRAVVASTGGSLLRELTLQGVPHLMLPVAAAGRWQRWRAARALGQFARRHQVDLIHARVPSQAVGPAARRCGASFLTTLYAPDDIAGGGSAAIGGDRVIAASELVADALAARPDAEPDRTRLVRRWVSLQRFDPDAVRGDQVVAVAERCGVPAGPRVVMVPSQIARAADHRLLIAVLPHLARHDLLLLITGALDPDGAEARRLLEDLRAAGWGERVRFCPGADDLPAAIALADLVLQPATRPEPSIRLLAAAQAMGKPVVVTDVGALGEAVMPASTGWLVGAADAAEIAGAVDLALAMPDEARDRLAARARAFAAERFDARTRIADELEVYRELCPRTPARA